MLFCLTAKAQQASLFETITTANGLPSNYVFCTEEDTEGFLWVGTDKGLCRYNGVIWEVWDVDNGLPGNYVNRIYSDKHNGLWLGIAEKGIFHFDCSTKKIIQVLDASFMTISVNTSGDFLFTKTDTAKHIATTWICNYRQLDVKTKMNEVHYTDEEVIHIDSAAQLVHHFEFKNQKKMPITPTSFGIIKHSLSTITLTPKVYNFMQVDHFLINTHYIFHFYNNPQKDTLLLLKSPTTATGHIAYCDTKDVLYVARSADGIYCIDKNTNFIKHYTESNGLNNLNINHIFQDKYGTLFISTLGGGIHVLNKNPRNHFVPKQLPFRNLQVRNDQYYGLANGTLFLFDKNQIKTEIFLRKDALCFYITHDTLLVGSFEGLHYYKFTNNTAKLVRTLALTAGISSIVPFHNKWLYSTYGGGFYATADLIAGEKIHNFIPFANIEKTVLLKNAMAALSFEEGFFICDKDLQLIKHFTTQEGLLSNYVSSMLEKGDTLWVGGKAGVSIIANGKVIKTLSYKEGFKGNQVKSMFINTSSAVQIVSDKFMHIANYNTLRAYGGNYVKADKSDEIVEALYDVKSNQLIAATKKNIGIVDMTSLTPDNHIYDASPLAIFMDGKQLPVDQYFEADYTSNIIQFRFKPLSNMLFNATELFYKLNEGDWQLAPDSLVIDFKKLRYGNYTLYTKTINGDGFESKPKMTATFSVNKPIWLQWWFVILCFAAFAFSIWQIARYVNKKKMRNAFKQQQQLEAERQRISRDLHDNMGAYTSALIANVQQLKSKIGMNEETDKMQNNAESILNSLRETIWVLNNKEVHLQEFNDGFKNYCFKVLKNFEDIRFEATENIVTNPLLTASTAIHLNKIMQEVIQNMIKHAQASQINYNLTDTNGIAITLSDNGMGFDSNLAVAGNGLSNMQWRAKEAGLAVTVTTTPGKGTTVSINTPSRVLHST